MNFPTRNDIGYNCMLIISTSTNDLDLVRTFIFRNNSRNLSSPIHVKVIILYKVYGCNYLLFKM